MLFTPLPIVTHLTDSTPANKSHDISLQFIVTLVKLVQYPNAEFPIVVTGLSLPPLVVHQQGSPPQNKRELTKPKQKDNFFAFPDDTYLYNTGNTVRRS